MSGSSWISRERDAGVGADEARGLLAPLFGEGQTGAVAEQSPRASAESGDFRWVRDQVKEWLEASADEAAGEGGLRKRVLDYAAQPGAAAEHRLSIVPQGREIWIQRDADRAPMPVREQIHVQDRAIVAVPVGARARIKFADRSALFLDGRTVLGLDLGKTEEPCRLMRGRLFARVKRQKSGRFSVGTGLGRVAVVGTAFGLDMEDPSQVRLLVAEGSVEYRPSGADRAVEAPAVRRRQRLIHAPGSLRVVDISEEELRDEIDWARGPAKRLHYAALASLALAVVFAAVYLVMSLAALSPSRARARIHERASAQKYQSTHIDSDVPKEWVPYMSVGYESITPGEPVALSPVDIPVGGGYRYLEAAQRESEWGGWVGSRVAGYTIRLIAREDDGTLRFSRTFDGLGYGDLATTGAAEIAAYSAGDTADKRIIGRTIEYAVSKTGEVFDLRVADGGEWNGWLKRIAAESLLTDPLRVFASYSALPVGVHWNAFGESVFEGDTDGFFRHHTSCRLRGYQEVNGMKLARFEANIAEVYGGMRYEEQADPATGMSSELNIKQREAKLRMVYFVEPETGRLHKAGCDIVTGQRDEERILTPPHGHPEVTELVSGEYHFRFALDVEYLPPPEPPDEA